MTGSETTIRRVAEEERDRVRRLLTEHVRACRHHGCRECRSLSRHLGRAELQLELLTPEEAGSEALF